ncbi:MAG: hypothetical protein ACOC9Q_02445 [bacterium]
MARNWISQPGGLMSTKGPQCTICRHDKRHQIELGLVHKTPLRTLAARFDVSPDALHRHSKNHLSAQLRAALLTAQRPSDVDLEALERSESEGLLSQSVHQRARLQALSEQALNLGDVRAAVSVENAITNNLTFVAKLLGMLVQRHEVQRTSILVSADYLQLRQAIVTALRPYPEAARAVGQALHALEAEAAQDITDAKRPIMLEAQPAHVNGGALS